MDRTSTWETRGRRPLHRAPGSCACKGSGRKQSCHPGACTQGVGPFPVSTVYPVPRVELASDEHSVTIGTSLSKHWCFYQNTGYFSVVAPTPHPSPHRTARTCRLPLGTEGWDEDEAREALALRYQQRRDTCLASRSSRPWRGDNALIQTDQELETGSRGEKRACG